jgi:pimeloyl-ACP methyl ester carboxylesterase
VVLEEDLVFVGARILPFLGGITTREARNLNVQLGQAYQEYRSDQGFFGTPLVRTTLGMQSPAQFDLLIFPPGSTSSAGNSGKQALIFLHGTGGNWSLLCWLVSRAASSQGLWTFCPSVGLLGDWNSKAGRETLSRTITHVEERGLKPAYLAGLSAGAVGAAAIAAESGARFEGVILLFGIHPAAVKLKVPTLIISGQQDERFPAWLIASIAAREQATNLNTSIIPIDGDHFALLKQSLIVREAIASWLDAQESGGKEAQKTTR